MMTMEAGFKMINKVCKRREKNSKKDLEGREDDVLSCQNETCSNDSIQILEVIVMKKAMMMRMFLLMNLT